MYTRTVHTVYKVIKGRSDNFAKVLANGVWKSPKT